MNINSHEQTIKIFIPNNKNVEIYYCNDNIMSNNMMSNNMMSNNIIKLTKNNRELSDSVNTDNINRYIMIEENCKRSGGNLI